MMPHVVLYLGGGRGAHVRRREALWALPSSRPPFRRMQAQSGVCDTAGTKESVGPGVCLILWEAWSLL